MKSILFAALGLLVSTQAFAANPTSKEVLGALRASKTLAGIQQGVAKDHGLNQCQPYKVTSYDAKEGVVQAESWCLFTDSEGDGSGVQIKVEGVFWDNSTLMLQNVAFSFAG